MLLLLPRRESRSSVPTDLSLSFSHRRTTHGQISLVYPTVKFLRLAFLLPRRPMGGGHLLHVGDVNHQDCDPDP